MIGGGGGGRVVTTLNSIVLNDCMFSFVRYFLRYTFFATWILLCLFDVGVEIETKPRLENCFSY